MMMMTNEEQLALLAECGVIVELAGTGKYRVGGFYKSGQVLVDLPSRTVTGRYDEVTSFDGEELIDHLIMLNDKWHLRSADRFEGWKEKELSWTCAKVRRLEMRKAGE